MGSIRKLAFVLVAIVVAGCGSMGKSNATAHSAPDLLFNYHFVGTSQLFKDTNSATLKKAWELPDSIALRNNVLEKLASTPGRLLPAEAGGLTNSAALIRPLLDDLLAVESLAEIRRGTNAPGEVVFAIRIPKERIGLWETNLQKVFAGFTKSEARKATWEKFNGWEVKQATTPNLIRSIWTGEWLVLGIGQTELPLQNNMLRRLAAGNLPADWKGKTNWLESTIDLPRLQHWLPVSQLPFKPAKTEIALSSKNDNIRTVLRAVYPTALNWKGQKWQIPTNIVRDPIISFTAAQNLSTLVKSPEVLAKTGVNPMTNQFFLWSQAQMPFMTFGAMPVKDSQKTFDHLTVRMPQLFNEDLAEAKAGSLVLSSNKQNLLWSGVSILAPGLRATNDTTGEFIFGGLFAVPPSRQAPPQELIQQISSRTNLIYYDWEITQHRLGQWQVLSKMLPFMQLKRLPVSPEVVAQAKTNEAVRLKLAERMLDERWQSRVAPLLGNSITEVTLVAPNEIELIRRSHIGFTGIELLYLSHWLNDPRFPITKDGPPPKK